MAALEFTKKTSLIPRGEKTGRPVYTSGARVRSLGFPTNPNGSSALTGSLIGFEGSFDGVIFHTINDFRGFRCNFP